MMYTVKIPFKLITKIAVMKKTTVTIDGDTKEKLATFGKKGESFDVILQRVMDNTNTLCNKTSEDNVVEDEEPMEEE